MIQHKELAAGRWATLSLSEQMANVGSEVERALLWQEKRNQEYSTKAFDRALELLSLTIDTASRKTTLRELTRLYEVLVDFFFGSNEYKSSAALWRSYFMPFTYAARRTR